MIIAIEGCIGVGKSTIANLLSSFRNSNLILEKFDANPFLADFYQEPEKNAIETEFAFLLLHFNQLKLLPRKGLRSEYILDFHLGKDLLYADLNLTDARAKELFTAMYDFFSDKVPDVDLMICLSIDSGLLIDRIRLRNRVLELAIDTRYYERLNEKYESFFDKYSGRKLRIDMNQWDFVREDGLVKRLSSLVDDRSGE